MAVGDVPSQARIRASLKQAWTNIWPNFWWLLLFGLLAGLASGTGNSWRTSDLTDVGPTDIGLGVGGGLLTLFVGIPLGMGLTKAHLAASRGQKPTWSDLGYAFGPRYWPTIGLAVLSVLIVVGGLLLLIIPGIYWGVRLCFAQQRFIEDRLGVMDAIRASRRDVDGRWWNVFGMLLMAIPLFVAGALALVVGLFVAMVLVQQLHAVYWRAVQAQNGPYTPARAG